MDIVGIGRCARSSTLTLKIKLLFEVLLKGFLAVVVLAILHRNLSFRLCRSCSLVLPQGFRWRPPCHRGRWFGFLLEIHLWPSWEVGGHTALTLPLHIWPFSLCNGQLLDNPGSSALPTIFDHFCVWRLTFGLMHLEQRQRHPMHKSQLLQIFFCSGGFSL